MKQVLLLGAALLAAQGAVAQEQQKFYVFGQVGSASVSIDKSGDDAALRAAGATNLSSTVNQSAGAVLLGAGYRFDPHASVELGYIKVADYTYKASFSQGTATDKFSGSGFGINLVGYVPFTPIVTGYGKVGLWNFTVDETATISAAGFAQATQSSSNTTPMLGLGVDFKIAQQVSLRVEYDYFSKVGDAKTMGESKLNYLSGGIAVAF